MIAVSLALAFAAACCNATSSVLQRKANREEPPDEHFGPKLLLNVLRRPAWLFGLLAMVVSFLLQAAALASGTLSSVEPVIAIELPITLILASRVFGAPLHRRDWLSAAAMAVGLALLVATLDPRGGDAARVSNVVTLLAAGATVVVIAGLVVAGRAASSRGDGEATRGAASSAFFGAAAGLGFGLTASVIKLAMADLTHRGVVAMLESWPPYAVMVCGVGSVLLVQAALHAGTLVAAQPGITLGDPLVSLLWGTIVLGEDVRGGPILLLAGLGAVIVAVAVLGLAKAAQAAEEHEEQLQDEQSPSGSDGSSDTDRAEAGDGSPAGRR